MTERERAAIKAARRLLAAVSNIIPETRYAGGYADDRSEEIEIIRTARDELKAALDAWEQQERDFDEMVNSISNPTDRA